MNNSPMTEDQKRDAQLTQTARSHKAWVYRNPNGLVRDLKSHLEQLLAELEACMQSDTTLEGDLRDYVYAVLETIEVDVVSEFIDEENLETSKDYLASDIERLQESINQWGDEIRFPSSATPAEKPVVVTKMIDDELRQRVAPYINSTLQPSLHGVLDHLQMVNSEIEEGEIWDPSDPRKEAIDAYLEATTIDDPLVQLRDDIYLVESLIAAWGDRWVN